MSVYSELGKSREKEQHIILQIYMYTTTYTGGDSAVLNYFRNRKLGFIACVGFIDNFGHHFVGEYAVLQNSLLSLLVFIFRLQSIWDGLRMMLLIE